MSVYRQPEEGKEITTVTDMLQLGSEIDKARSSIMNSFQTAESLLDEADKIYKVGHILCMEYYNHSCAHFLAANNFLRRTLSLNDECFQHWAHV